MYHILYNHAAGSYETALACCKAEVEKLGQAEIIDVQDLESHKALVETLLEDDVIVICGGDGTINHFANALRGVDYSNKVLYYPGGSGNDFFHCVTGDLTPRLIDITKWLKNLPCAYINGKEYIFVNGIGFGIDGYCCQVGDEMKAKGKSKINYTMIAILGVLFKYKPTGVTITVDGAEHRFENAWIAPTMNGRFYGGGMMPAPNQARNSGELSVMVFHIKSRLRLLTLFPSLFKGEHIKHEKHVSVFTGKDITVKYDVPTPLQVDGETILGVTECRSVAHKSWKATV
jgi:diacylglycerol kinase family enzyme